MRQALVWGGGVLALLTVAFVVFLRPTILPSFDGASYLKNGAKYDVRILRDTFGVPHVYGTRDEDVAFGLAYAHAEDDFGTIAETLAMIRGRAGAMLGPDGAKFDGQAATPDGRFIARNGRLVVAGTGAIVGNTVASLAKIDRFTNAASTGAVAVSPLTALTPSTDSTTSTRAPVRLVSRTA